MGVNAMWAMVKDAEKKSEEGSLGEEANGEESCQPDDLYQRSGYCL